MSEPQTETPDETPDETLDETPDETPTPIQPPDADDEDDEPETGDVGQADEPAGDEPHEHTDEPQALSQKDIEQRLEKLNREGERHFKRVHEIMREQMRDLAPCELCWSFAPGFRFQPVPDEQRANVMIALELSEVAAYVHDRHSEACAECNGWGMVATGSKVNGQDALTCLNCGGKGWMGDRAPETRVALTPVAPIVPANGEHEPTPQSPEVAEAIRIAKAAGAIVIEPTVPAPA